MKILTSALIFSIIAGSSSGATIAYWNIPAADDNTLTDLSGNGHTLVGSGNPVNQSGLSLTTFPVPNPDPLAFTGVGSIFMNGYGEAVHIDAATPFQMTASSSFTMEGWIRANTGASGYIASDRHRANGFRGWFLELQAGGNLQFYSNSGGTASSITSSSISDSTDHHFAAVWNHSASEMRLYLDGDLVGSPASHAVGTYGVHGFSIGGRQNTSSQFNSNLLTAGTRLDELRFSDAALLPKDFLNFGASVPEPSGSLLILTGMLLLSCFRRRRI